MKLTTIILIFLVFGILAILFGCSPWHRWKGAMEPPDPCETLEYPHREPTPKELEILNKYRDAGRCEDAQRFLDYINR